MRAFNSRRLLTVLGAMVFLLLGLPTAGFTASPTLSATGLAVTMNGSIVTASTTIASSPGATATYAGVCARSASGAKRDFPFQSNDYLSPGGTAVSGYQPLPVGTYTFWSCAKIGGVWFDIGVKQNFTVTPDSPPSGPVGMPVGNLPHFQQIFTDDFTTDLAQGSFPGSYAGKWASYDGFPDSRNKGDYNQKIISMHDGMMDMNVQVVNGRVQGAAPSPLINNGTWSGQTYGKYSVRFKADSMTGVSAAWLLWPDSNNWDDGELDFPEGAFNGPFWAFDHCVDNPSVNCDYLNSQTTYATWHVVSIEWTPQNVKFLLDGVTVLTSTNVPRTAMHWVLQTESNVDTARTGGHVYVDWVAVYRYVP